MPKPTKGDRSVRSKLQVSPPALPPGGDYLLNRKAIAAALQVSLRMVDGMVASGQFPPADVTVGTLRRWRLTTFNAWVEKGGAGSPRA